MAHEIDETTGRAAFAFNPAHPDAANRWHMLGRPFTLDQDGKPVADTAILAADAGLDYKVQRARVRFATARDQDSVQWGQWDNQHVLFRSDTRKPLAVVSDSYVIHHQPAEMLAEIRRQAAMIGAELSTAMALKEGRMIVATAKLDAAHSVYGSPSDVVRGYITYGSSFDGTMKTEQFFTDICVVCANTYAAGRAGARGMVKTSHKSEHDSAKADLLLGLHDFAERMRMADEMARAAMDPADLPDFLSRVYLETSEDEARADKATAKQLTKLLARVLPQAVSAPGQMLPSRRNTVWGAFNTVTHDVDHVGVAKTDDGRAVSAMFGDGARIKARAWQQALALAA